jgi:hypothetical protein
MMRTAEAVPVFPATTNTLVRQGAYGWTSNLIPNVTLPTVGQVQQHVLYGANGTEFEGTFMGGVTPAPATPAIHVTNVGDGKAILVTIQLADTGTTNRIFCQPIGHYQNPMYLTSIIGNGTATVYPGYCATYVFYVSSTIGNSLSAVGISNYVELVGANAVRTELMQGPANAHYEVCKVVGVRVAFTNTKNDPWIGLWALDISQNDTVTVHGGETSVRRAVMEIPRQAGWPPPKVNVQAIIKIPETARDDEHYAFFGIENLPSINASIGITPVFRVELKRYDFDSRLGG